MQQIILLGQNFISLLTPMNLLVISLASIGGILVGALPGLTTTMGIALLTGVTYGMDHEVALLVLMGLYVGSTYGGSISAILVGIPGTGSAAATVLDGHVLAVQGRGKQALSLATIASFIGTIFGMLCLVVFTPMLQSIALKFTSPEYTLLAIFGITICGSLSSNGNAIKGWIAGFIGMALSAVGLEGMYSYPRLSFGSVGLMGGIAMVPAMIGFFGIPSILKELSKTTKDDVVVVGASKEKQDGIFKLLKKHLRLILQSGVIGTFVGAIPGVGEDVAAWLSYDTAKKGSKESEKFGKGSVEGVIAAETANNSAIGGALIPLLSLGVPGSPPTAVLLGALMLHGIRPGPMLKFDQPDFIVYMCALLILSTVCMRIFGFLICQQAPRILKIPGYLLMSIVGVLSVIGSYAVNNSLFDVYVMLIIGFVAFFLVECDYPAAPVVLGLILGKMIDTNLRRTLVASHGSLLPFVTRPICIVLLLMIAFSFLSQMSFVKKLVGRLFSLKTEKGKAESGQ